MKKTKLYEQVCSQEVIYCYEDTSILGDDKIANTRIRLSRFYDSDENKWMGWVVQYNEIDKLPEYVDKTYLQAVLDAMADATKKYGE